MEPEAFFAGHPDALAAFVRTRQMLQELGPVEIRASKSQVAFWRRHGFACLWLPGQYLKRPAAEVVLSIALGRRLDSPRFKEVVHPSARHWIHHLELNDPAQIHGEMAGWLAEAAERSG